MRRSYVAAGLLLVALGAGIYLWRIPSNPPGFYLDESSICYNAHTISQTGRDEYGVAWPLFFRAFGEYKNPTLIYLLAALFKVTGPSIAVARYVTAGLGLFASVLLGLLAWRMTKRFVIAAAVTVAAWLTPWLFECSRVVLEVAAYPCLLGLFLLTVWRVSRKTEWNWGDIVALSTTLALLTYSYSIGRLLGPLFAIGLALLITKSRGWRDLLRVWLGYGVFLVPMLVFQQRHPGALTDRFKALTYLANDKPAWASLAEFIRRYVADVNPSRWLISGGTDVRDHVDGTGSMLAAIVLLGLVGLYLVGRHHWRDPWSRFILYGLAVSVVPGALTRNEFSQLRLIAFPMFFLVLTIPALEWLMAGQGAGRARRSLKRVGFIGAIMAMIIQGGYFQWLYHRSTPGLWYVFEARFPRKVLEPALATGSKPVYLIDGPGKSGYIQALWHGVLASVEPERFVRLGRGAPIPPGAVAISTEEECTNCTLIARSLNFIVYSVPPSPANVSDRKAPLAAFRAAIAIRSVPSSLHPAQEFKADLLVRNISPVEWPAVGETDGRYAVKVSARWRHESGEVLGENSHVRRLPYDVEPGDTVGFLFELITPERPGGYSLEFDLMQEGIGWFADHGSDPAILKVRVTPSASPNR